MALVVEEKFVHKYREQFYSRDITAEELAK